MGMSQERLGEVLDLSRKQILRWEAGVNHPRLPALERLAELSGKPLTWFFEDRPNRVTAERVSRFESAIEEDPSPAPGNLPPTESPTESPGEGLFTLIEERLLELAGPQLIQPAPASDGELLQRARKVLRANQKEFARRAGLKEEELRGVEGDAPAYAYARGKVIRALGFDPEDS